MQCIVRQCTLLIQRGGLLDALYGSLPTHHTLTLETPNKKLQSTSVFRTDDRSLLRRGMTANLFVVELERINFVAPGNVTDIYQGAPRYIQRAKGIYSTIGNGAVLMKKGIGSFTLTLSGFWALSYSDEKFKGSHLLHRVAITRNGVNNPWGGFLSDDEICG